MKTYLVTGGAGFIGSNYIHYMFKKYGDSIRIINVDKLTYAGNLETLKPVENEPNYKFVKGDIADRPFIMDLFEKEKFDVQNFGKSLELLIGSGANIIGTDNDAFNSLQTRLGRRLGDCRRLSASRRSHKHFYF